MNMMTYRDGRVTWSSSMPASCSRAPSMPGVDLILPDTSYVDEHHATSLGKAIVITHAHEDHIGALPYLLREAIRRARLRHEAHARR